VIIAPHPENETLRLAVLQRLAILDTPPEAEFDRVARLAARILHVPVAMVTLIDQDRQWLKAKVGVTFSETPREQAFCSHAILQRDALVVGDAGQDPRFHDNPLVTGPPHIRFYAGQPLHSRDGLALGTLCVTDTQPRVPSEDDLQALRDLAHIAEQALQAREAMLLSRQLHAEDAQASLQATALYRDTVEQAPVGIAHITPDGDWLLVNSCLLSMLGYRRDELFRRPVAALIDESDWHRLEGLTSRLRSGYVTEFQQELRLRHNNGSQLWGNLTVALHRNERGEAERFILIVEDIERRKYAENALLDMHHELERRVEVRTRELAAARQELITITDHLPILIAYIDREHIYRFVNATYGEWFGVDHQQLIGKPARQLLEKEAQQTLTPYVEKVLQGLKVRFNASFRFNGLLRDVRFTIVPDEDEEHHVRGYYQMVQDISQLTRLMEQLRGQAFADALTGLPNRRAMLEHLKNAIARQKRHQRPLAALFLDLDGFKAINDTYGHDAGDELLKQFAQRLKGCVRETDTVARLAGDEFTILLESLNDAVGDSTQVAEKVIAAMTHPFRLENDDVTVSTSIGIAIRAAYAKTDSDSLLTQADEAMYRAKRSGKNRYVLG
jgi:diguanylate cyclase (GGDEF)-like protein/PAS domain S-box-containing protein